MMLMRVWQKTWGDFGDASSECNGEVDGCEHKSDSIYVYRNQAMVKRIRIISRYK